VAVEVKSTNMVNPHHIKGLKSFAEEYRVKKLLVISTDPYPRKIGDVTILPWKLFLEQLWAGEII
jgi:predicted AAA+ superfamily ATPase